MNSTTTSPHLLWHRSTASTILIISPFIKLLVSTTCLIILNTYLKKLHKTFKTLLNIVLISNLIEEFAIISLNTYTLTTHSQDFINCTLRVVIGGSNTYFTFYSLSIMSFLRYRIAWKINNLESTKNMFWWMMGPIILCAIVEFLITIPLTLISNIFFDMPSFSTLCAGAKLEGNFPILPFFNFLKLLFSMLIGIRYDFLMISFLKKKNSHPEPGQSKLVLWKSGEENYDFMIPTTSTITVTIFEVASLIISSFMTKGIINNQLESWKVAEILLKMCTAMHMPILIGLSIRAAKHKKPAPKIPKGPIFHEDINIDISDRGEEIQMSNSIGSEDQNNYEGSSSDTLSPKPKIINVKPCSVNDVA